MKKTVSWLLVAVLVIAMAVPAAAAPTGEKLQKIAAMNGLLTGVTFYNTGAVSDWSDEEICRILESKLIWDGYLDTPWLTNLDIAYDDFGYRVERGVVEQLTRELFDREFVPVEEEYMLKLSGDDVLFGIAVGEHTECGVQDYIQKGDYYVAVGAMVAYNNIGSDFSGYFQAIFRENPDSLYGMTLVSLEEISGNQSFYTLTAEASSELSGGDFDAGNVLDGREATAWVEGVSGTGSGQWIRLYTQDYEDLQLCAVEILPGYHKNEDILEKNGCPYKLLIETDSGYAQTEECYSTELQAFLLDTPGAAASLKLTILEASAGSKYSDTCISEIRLFGIDTESYFRDLDLTLPEETAEETAPAQTEPSAPETTQLEQETEAAPTQPQEEPVPGNTGLSMETLLLLLLAGLGSLVVAGGIGILIVILRKKKQAK